MQTLPKLDDCTIAVIGLGYVGLPLAVEFAKPQSCRRTGVRLRRRVIGFDIDRQRLHELRHGVDRTKETTFMELQEAQLLEFSSDTSILAQADVFVVTVPTPIDSSKRPDLSPLEKASITVGNALKARTLQGPTTTPLVIYESTVFPGATEEICVPILEYESSLSFNEGFACGYSPERINPGDKKHRLISITKVTSGSTPEVADWVDALYGSVIHAGTHRASSIKVAEAAKVIENTQRDLNIALINELAIIFSFMQIDTHDVLSAAGSKWNFLRFKPGLVGGHCIGVDPYYLTYKAEQLGYHPQVVLAGRRINDGMPKWIAERVVLQMAQRDIKVSFSNLLILGYTFKENCPDIRNSKVKDLASALLDYNIQVDIVDPFASSFPQVECNQVEITSQPLSDRKYNAVILAVSHSQFTNYSLTEWRCLLADDSFVFDLKSIVPPELNPIRL